MSTTAISLKLLGKPNQKDLKDHFIPSSFEEPWLKEDDISYSFPTDKGIIKNAFNNGPFFFKQPIISSADLLKTFSYKKGGVGFVDKEFKYPIPSENPVYDSDISEVCFDTEFRKSLKSAVSEICLPELVAKCLKDGKDVDLSKVNYSVGLLSLNGAAARGFVDSFYNRVYGQFETSIYLDTPLGVCLFINDVPACVMGFTIHNDQHVLKICQLQGVQLKPQNQSTEAKSKTQQRKLKTHSWALEPIDWPKLLVLIGTNLAEKIGATSIEIKGVRNNGWAKSGGENLKRFLKIYDDTAIRLGFHLTPDFNWATEIGPIHTWQKLKALRDVSLHQIQYAS